MFCGPSVRLEQDFELGIRREDGYVFRPGPGDEPWTPNKVSRQFGQIADWKKLPEGLRFHDLRHGYATLCFASGTSLKVVLEALAIRASPSPQRSTCTFSTKQRSKTRSVLTPASATHSAIQRSHGSRWALKSGLTAKRCLTASKGNLVTRYSLWDGPLKRVAGKCSLHLGHIIRSGQVTICLC